MKRTGLATVFALAAIGLCSGAGAISARPPPHSGAKMPNGMVYAGISPYTHKPFYTTPEDGPGMFTTYQIAGFCGDLDAFGHKDWRVPSPEELNVLYNHRVAIGGFKISGSNPAVSYWATAIDFDFEWAQNFSDGNQNIVNNKFRASLRCVR